MRRLNINKVPFSYIPDAFLLTNSSLRVLFALKLMSVENDGL